MVSGNDKKNSIIFSILLFIIGVFLLSFSDNLTGAFIGVLQIYSLFSFIGSLFLLSAIAVLLSTENLEEKIEWHWKKYPINKDSVIEDIEQEYLSRNEPEIKTAAQSWAERHSKTGRELIEDDKLNKRRTYEEQFYEGHAAKSGRVIDVSSHVIRDKNDINKLVSKTNKGLKYFEGRLIHFGEPAKGRYLWVVDEDENFIIANRSTFQHEMPQMNKERIDYQHRLHKLSHATLAREKKVFGSGDVLIEGGLIKEINTHSGHYLPITITPSKISDFNEKSLIEAFNKQGIEVFKFFKDKNKWKEVKEGAKYII